ncbi:hypothetical protein [Paraprevotella xylaniphila]|uniref:hypothetical protein n=1 Tax=Paraprevotella xylaniphila TaxID=454155 RepID=UPI0039F51756
MDSIEMDIGCFFALFCIFGIILNEKEEKNKKSRKEDYKKRIAKEQEYIKNEYEKKKCLLIEKYGEPDKDIIIKYRNLQSEIMSFSNFNRIWILGHDYSMDDIIGCSLHDEQSIQQGTVSFETKVKTGNMVKRAAVGGLLFGGAGAVIGGVTAKKASVSRQEDDKVVHNYIVFINVNSMSTPVISVNVGEDVYKANAIVSLINVIIYNRDDKS